MTRSRVPHHTVEDRRTMSKKTTPADVSHLWRRAAFGIDAAGAEQRAGQPWRRLVDELIEPDAAPMPRPAALDDPSLAGGGEFFRALSVSSDWLDHMAVTPTPGAEKLAWFWHNHFTTSMVEAPWGEGLHRQLSTLRHRGQGPFRSLLGDMVVDSAMCFYLDNVHNLKGRTNENFARELLELFTVGVDHYTEEDVVDAARSLTGHNLDWSGSLLPLFHPDLHDDGIKTVLGATGRFDAPALCDVICNAENRVLVARHVAHRLWSAWAHPSPSAALVDNLAQTALAGGFTGRSFARAVLLHPEFRGPLARSQYLHTPLELAIALAKLAGASPSSLGVPTILANCGHFPYLPPNVGGWPPAQALLSSQAWWQLGHLHFSAASAAMSAAPSGVPDTAALEPPDAALAWLRWAGIVDPAGETVSGLAAYIGTVRASNAGSEPMAAAMAATLSPDFAAGGRGV